MATDVRLTWDNNAVTATSTRIERRLAPLAEDLFDGTLNETIVGRSLPYSRAPAAGVVWTRYDTTNDYYLTGSGGVVGAGGGMLFDFGTSDYIAEVNVATPDVLGFEDSFMLILDTDSGYDQSNPSTSYNRLTINKSGRVRYYERNSLIVDFGANSAPNDTQNNFFRVTKVGTALTIDAVVPGRSLDTQLTATLASAYTGTTFGGINIRGTNMAELADFTVTPQ